MEEIYQSNAWAIFEIICLVGVASVIVALVSKALSGDRAKKKI